MMPSGWKSFKALDQSLNNEGWPDHGFLWSCASEPNPLTIRILNEALEQTYDHGVGKGAIE
jgi:hypothetical protein